MARMMASAVVVKAIIMGTLTVVLGTTFLQSIILVTVSAAVTGAFGVVIAVVTARATRNTHATLARMEERQSDVASALGVDKRKTDEPNGGD